MLQGLFRTAQQKKPAEFLGRAFTSDKDRAAAAKNAFVLLAQHKPQMAAAFFILGDGCPWSRNGHLLVRLAHLGSAISA